MKKHYHKYCKNLTYVIIFTSLFSTKAISQETQSFKITPEITKSIVEKYGTEYPDVFPVIEKEVKYINNLSKTVSTRNALTVVNPSIDSDSLNGEFRKLKFNYRVGLVDVDNQFVKDELFIDTPDVEYNKRQMTKSYPLIQNISTGKYYYIMTDEFIGSIIKDGSTNEILKIVHKLGFKEYKNPNDQYDDNVYIKSKACEIKLNNWTYEELKKNPSYISTLDAYQMKLDALIRQTIPHSKTLDKYLGLHRIQRNHMSTANINAWKVAVAQAQKLNDQIYTLSEKYEGDSSFMPLSDLSNIRNNFSDNLRASKDVLGM